MSKKRFRIVSGEMVEMATLKEPVFGKGYDAFDRILNHKLSIQEYEAHLASLTRYPLADPSEWVEGSEHDEGSFELGWCVNADAGRWIRITDYVYSIYPENLQKLCSQKAYPLTKREDKEEELWKEVFSKVKASGYKSFIHDQIIEGLKSKYTITRK